MLGCAYEKVNHGVPLFFIQTTEFVLKRPEIPNPVV